MRFRLSQTVESMSLGMFPKVDKEALTRMADRSAPHTHPLANRRYMGVLFRVVADEVVAAFDLNMATAYTHTFVKCECPDCEGTGGRCQTCQGTGGVTRTLEQAYNGGLKVIVSPQFGQAVRGASPRFSMLNH